MSFEPKEWPDQTDPLGPPADPGDPTLDGAGIIDIEVRVTDYADSVVAPVAANVAVVKEGPINVEYPEYGADGTRATDSIAAFEKAIAALPERGGEIFVPRAYELTKKLNLDGKRTVRLSGQGGRGSGLDPASQLLFTQSGAEPLVSAKGCQGFSAEGLEIEYTSATQTGAAIEMEGAGEGTLERVHIIGVGGIHSAIGVSLNAAQVIAIRDCQISGVDIGLKGRKDNSGENFSNVIEVANTSFNGAGTASIKNIGLGWLLNTCVFEPLSSEKAGAITADAGVLAEGTVLQGCFWGDAKAEGTQVLWRGKGLTITGGYLGSGALGISVPDTTSDAVNIQGVKFLSLTDAIRLNFGAGTQRYVIGGNAYEASVTGKKVSLDNGATDAGAGFLSH